MAISNRQKGRADCAVENEHTLCALPNLVRGEMSHWATFVHAHNVHGDHGATAGRAGTELTM